MTSPTSAATNPRARLAVQPSAPGRRASSRRGFSLVELLVVISIIAVLAAIIAPATMKAWRQASRTATANDLQAIGAALEAFKADTGDYPRVTGASADPEKLGYDGAITLCQALLGPADTDDLDDDDGNLDPITVATNERKDLGFRLRPGGKVYGPYLPAERFQTRKIVTVATVTIPETESTTVLLDRDGQPILYFPASPTKPNVRIAATSPYVGQADTSRYDANDNLGATASPFGPFTRSAADAAAALERIRLILRDDNKNGYIDGTEEPVDLPFVLWSAGPDSVYGPNADMAGDTTVLNRADADKCDDVTNFR